HGLICGVSDPRSHWVRAARWFRYGDVRRRCCCKRGGSCAPPRVRLRPDPGDRTGRRRVLGFASGSTARASVGCSIYSPGPLSVEKKRLVGRRLAISICGIVACDPTGTLELCALFDRIERLVRILLKREWPVVLVCGKACVLCRELLRSECDTFQVRV